MKLYIVFKAKDMNKRNKEFIIDSIYTNEQDAQVREVRLHHSLDGYKTRGLNKSKHQQTYIVRKPTKGKIVVNAREVIFGNKDEPIRISVEQI
jgi:hypothetical protein